MNDQIDIFARPVQGNPSAGIGIGSETHFADGFKIGDVRYRFGTKESVVRDLPGWVVADGTQATDLVIDGVNYGKPNLGGRVIMGATGVAPFTIGFSAGSDGVPPHTHSFTHESAHAITQPAFSDHTDSHTNNHAGTVVDPHTLTQPVVTAHGNHTGTPAEFTATPGSGVWLNTYNSAANAAAGLVHSNNHTLSTNVGIDNHNVGQPASHADHTDTHTRTTDVALTNNAPHAGGAVGAVATPSTGNYPPYVAIWPLLKVY